MRRPLAVAGTALALLAAPSCGEATTNVLEPAGSEADRLADVWWVLFGLAAAVYAVVGGLVVYAAMRGGRRASFSDNRFIVVGGLAVPLAVLLVVAWVTVDASADLREAKDGEYAIEVSGRRWWWQVTYPDIGFVTANEVHVPVGRPVDIRLTSDNVIHSFWVPELAGKVDTIPGQVNHLRFTALEPGVYKGRCAEYCGIQHAHMDFFVIALEPTEFARWRARNATPPTPETLDELAALGQRVFVREACAGCHAVAGTEADGQLGPPLTNFADRLTIGAGAAPNTEGHLAGWIVDAQSIKPGALMPPIALKPFELEALIAYLGTLE